VIGALERDKRSKWIRGWEGNEGNEKKDVALRFVDILKTVYQSIEQRGWRFEL